MFFQIM